MSTGEPLDSPPTSKQREFLEAFFDEGGSRPFMLAGGTALSGFYLHHRASDDLDLFTYDTEAMRGGVRLAERCLDRIEDHGESRVAGE